MPTERFQFASWPGIASIRSCRYTTSHGISPGIADLVALPQALAPPEIGDLVIGDGFEFLTISDCRIVKLTTELQGDGFVWSILIEDRRWKWKELGGISGEYNQLDEHAKLIPWTIRSPTELAILCLEAMGETDYIIDLPPGLNSSVGALAYLLNPPWIGVIPTTGTNPPISWIAVPPAQALASLAEGFGRRVWLRPDNRLAIGLPGIGSDLPLGSIAKVTPSISPPAVPSGLAVIGSPSVYQDRLPLEPVGKEWDGSYRPINLLSYAPLTSPKPQISQFIINTSTFSAGIIITLWVDGNIATYTTMNGDSNIVVANALTSELNESLGQGRGVQVAGTGIDGTITATGKADGTSFTMNGTATGGVGISVSNASVQEGSAGEPSWIGADVPTFTCVRPTSRLTWEEARNLAQESVFRCYRIIETGLRPPPPSPLNNQFLNSFPWNPIPLAASALRIGGYGPLARRQQIVLLDKQVEQVTPAATDQQLKDRAGFPITLNFYNGYSRGKPAAIYGAVASWLAGRFLPSTQKSNTDVTSQIYEDFSIDAEQQMIVFSNYVFYWLAPGYFAPPDLKLQTGFYIRNAETNQLEVFITQRRLVEQTDNTNFLIKVCPDVQFNVFVPYDENGVAGNPTLLEADPIARSLYYLNGMEAQYFTATGLTNEYNGIMPIQLDGAIMQITWEIGPNGARTTASRNTEHSVYVAPYPARRRAEFLASQTSKAEQENRTLLFLGKWVGLQNWNSVIKSAVPGGQ